ncbi:hypothetical protein ACQ4LE_001240 [Meloidogyne hapla]
MTINYDVRQDYLNVFSIFFCSICALFLIILIRPLYKFSKERTALFILFSKSCANITFQFLQIYMCIYQYFPSFMASFWSRFFLSPAGGILSTSIYIHITGLALNRFHAVFFPFSYQKIWKERNIKYIILILWIIIILWSALIYIGYTLGIAQNNFFRIFIVGVIKIGDLPLFTALSISTPIYLAVLLKFVYDYKIDKKEIVEDNTHKDRIRILAVCLVSLIPCPWYLLMYKLNMIIDENIQDTITSIIISTLFNTSLTILQCIEEICLVIISKEFRLLVKSQFIKNIQTSVVGKAVILKKSSQQERMNKMIINPVLIN